MQKARSSLVLVMTFHCLSVLIIVPSNAQTTTDSTTVRVIQNSPPVIISETNNYDTKTLDSRNPYEVDSIVYTVKSRDPESNIPVTHTLSRVYPSGNKYFTVDRFSGTIRTTIDLRLADVREVKLVITVADSKGISENVTLLLFIVLYARPDITNLPDTKSISENQATDYTITTLEAVPDLANTQLTWTLKPEGEEYKFQLDKTGRFKLMEALDYERTQRYTVFFVLSDSFSVSKGDELTIDVINVNEPPYFDQLTYNCVIDENDAGTSTCDIGATVRDPEGDRIQSVGFQESVSRYFRYDMMSSKITLLNYDVDVQSDKLIYHLVAKDIYGNENKPGVPVHITVRDVNDNTCMIPAITTVTLSQNDTPRKVWTFTKYDLDKTSPNKDVEYDVVQTVPDEANIYFAVATDGSVNYIEKIPESNNGKTYRLVVRCRDGGTPQRSAQGTILFVLQLSTTTSTTTTTTAAPLTTVVPSSSMNPFDNSAFVAIFTIFMVVLIIALLVGLYFCLRYCGISKYCFGINPTANKTKVIDISEYSNQSMPSFPPVRTNLAYNDDYWKNGDNYETGNVIKSSSRTVNGVFKHLALPAPAATRSFNF